METLTDLFTQALDTYIELGYLITFIFLSYGLRNLIADIINGIHPTKRARTFAVFFIGTVMALIWYGLFRTDLMKLFVTYSVGTSLYELIIQAIITKIKSKPDPKPFQETP